MYNKIKIAETILKEETFRSVFWNLLLGEALGFFCAKAVRISAS